MNAVLSVEFWTFVGVVSGIYTIFALGLQIEFGFAGILNFGHAAFMAIGAYTMAILIVKEGLMIGWAVLAAIAASAVFALILGLPTIRLRAEYFAIATLAFGEIVRYVILNERNLTGGSQGTIALAGAGVAADFNAAWKPFERRVEGWLSPLLGDDPDRNLVMLVIIWTIALLTILLLQVMVNSPWGRILRAIREDEDAAAALGKNVLAYKLQALVLGSVLGGVAGVLYAFQFSFVSPGDFDPLTTFFAWVILLLGGTGRNWAVPVGAVVFATIFAGTRFFEFFPFSLLESTERAYLRLIVIGVILIAIIAFRPQGLFGKREEAVLE